MGRRFGQRGAIGASSACRTRRRGIGKHIERCSIIVCAVAVTIIVTGGVLAAAVDSVVGPA
jgi:hypothetical protein